MNNCAISGCLTEPLVPQLNICQGTGSTSSLNQNFLVEEATVFICKNMVIELPLRYNRFVMYILYACMYVNNTHAH